MKPKAICDFLHLEYHRYRDTVKSYKYEWKKSKSRIGEGAKAPKSHAALAKGMALKSMNLELARQVGWVQSKNRNKMLVFSNRMFGNIKWYESGTILVSIKKPQTMARVKTLLCRAFFETGLIHDSKLLSPFLDKFDWKGAHDVFDFGVKLPHFLIDRYKESHGLLIRVDKSHLTGVEIEWVKPNWLERLELLQNKTLQVIENNSTQIIQFSEFMKQLTTPRTLRKDASRMVI